MACRRGSQTININAVQHMGGGDTDRPYFASHGRQLDIEIYSPWRRTSYHALQVGMTRPFTKGLLLKGHYTLSRSKALRTDYEVPIPEAQDRNWALANNDRPHTFTWRSCTSCHGEAGQPGQCHEAVINDWQLNGIFAGFSGSPFTVTADGASLNTPGTCRPPIWSGPVNKIGAIGAAGNYYDPAAWAQPEGVRFGTGRIEPVPRSRRLEPRLLGVPFVPPGRNASNRGRVEASNVTNTTKFANPRAI